MNVRQELSEIKGWSEYRMEANKLDFRGAERLHYLEQWDTMKMAERALYACRLIAEAQIEAEAIGSSDEAQAIIAYEIVASRRRLLEAARRFN